MSGKDGAVVVGRFGEGQIFLGQLAYGEIFRRGRLIDSAAVQRRQQLGGVPDLLRQHARPREAAPGIRCPVTPGGSKGGTEPRLQREFRRRRSASFGRWRIRSSPLRRWTVASG